ncbi:hypothetical protein BG004_008317 [Podila humilis]|nr:hypothetical protein BG004_008317 [Podila humilis]
MGIHKALFKDAEAMNPELTCLLCQQVLHQPYHVMCVQDHVFCKQCLKNYIDEQGRVQSKKKPKESTDNQHEYNVAKAYLPEYSSSPLTKIITVPCPQCQSEQRPPEELDIASFRPAKLVECHFSVQYPCPHHKHGCTYEGVIEDIAQHLRACRSCQDLRFAAAGSTVTSSGNGRDGGSVTERNEKSGPSKRKEGSPHDLQVSPLPSDPKLSTRGTASTTMSRSVQRSSHPMTPPQSSPIMEPLSAYQPRTNPDQAHASHATKPENHDKPHQISERDPQKSVDELQLLDDFMAQHEDYCSELGEDEVSYRMEELEVNDSDPTTQDAGPPPGQQVQLEQASSSTPSTQDPPTMRVLQMTESQLATLSPPWALAQTFETDKFHSMSQDSPSVHRPQNSVLGSPVHVQDVIPVAEAPRRRRRMIAEEPEESLSLSEGDCRRKARRQDNNLASSKFKSRARSWEDPWSSQDSNITSPSLSLECNRQPRPRLPEGIDDCDNILTPRVMPPHGMSAKFSEFAAQCGTQARRPSTPNAGAVASTSYLPLLVYTPRYTRSRRRKSHRERARTATGPFLTPIFQDANTPNSRVQELTPNITSPEPSMRHHPV